MSPLNFVNSLGPSELAYPVIAAALVLASFAFVLRPFVTLIVTIVYLVIANNSSNVLGQLWSAGIAALLIANCLLGTLLTFRRKPLTLHNLKMPMLLCVIATLGAIYGFARGNPTVLVFGDLYQILEFT